MKKSAKTLEFKLERTIPAPPSEVYDAWLNPKISGNPWNVADKLILNPKVDGFYYLLAHGFPHYGRFTKVERPGRIQHTWISPNTLGEESTVTLTFKKKGEDTLMTLAHSDLPDTEDGRSHNEAWNYFLDQFVDHFGSGARRKK
jgi:uncharacterized protein YndB with AHSA1/START domain